MASSSKQGQPSKKRHDDIEDEDQADDDGSLFDDKDSEVESSTEATKISTSGKNKQMKFRRERDSRTCRHILA